MDLEQSSIGKVFRVGLRRHGDSISRMLCWTIPYWKVSPVALVEDGNHWVVVHGYTAPIVRRHPRPDDGYRRQPQRARRALS